MSCCSHPTWELLQPWEYVRKYKCSACGGIAICACDRELGSKLPHQIENVRPRNRPARRLSVTLGFVERVCPTCRGEREPPYPRAVGRGRPSLIKRYYWREIAKHAYTATPTGVVPPPEAWRTAYERIKAEHIRAPKYDIEEHERGSPPGDLDQIEIEAPYVRGEDGVGRWEYAGRTMRVEDLVAEQLRAEGWRVLACERNLPAATFGTFMGVVMQDVDDPECTPMMFGRRDLSGDQVWVSMPLDHHSPAWFERREHTIRSHIDGLDDWEFLLDYWWEAFADYRDYLWAHKSEYKQLVRWLIELAPDKVRPLLLYLAEDYWHRYTGWPDLIARRGGELAFFEVKSPKDRLSEDQIRWLNDNRSRLRFSVTLVRVRPRGSSANPDTH